MDGSGITFVVSLFVIHQSFKKMFVNNNVCQRARQSIRCRRPHYRVPVPCSTTVETSTLSTVGIRACRVSNQRIDRRSDRMSSPIIQLRYYYRSSTGRQIIRISLRNRNRNFTVNSTVVPTKGTLRSEDAIYR